MADLSIQEFDQDGLEATYSAADSDGDTATNRGFLVLHVKNGDASSHTVTVTAQRTSVSVSGYGPADLDDVVVAIPAGGERFIGPLPVKTYNNANQKVEISYDAVTSVTIAAIKMTA